MVLRFAVDSSSFPIFIKVGIIAADSKKSIFSPKRRRYTLNPKEDSEPTAMREFIFGER